MSAADQVPVTDTDENLREVLENALGEGFLSRSILDRRQSYTAELVERHLLPAVRAYVAASQPKVDGDLRRVLWRALVVVNHYPSWYRNAALGKDVQPMIDVLAPAVEAYVATQVAGEEPVRDTRDALLRDVRDYLAARYDPEYAHLSPELGPLLERLNRALGTDASL